MRRFPTPSAFPWLLLLVFTWLSDAGAGGGSLSAATTAYDPAGNRSLATGPGLSPTVIHYLHDGGGRRVGRSQSDGGGWDTTWFLQLEF